MRAGVAAVTTALVLAITYASGTVSPAGSAGGANGPHNPGAGAGGQVVTDPNTGRPTPQVNVFVPGSPGSSGGAGGGITTANGYDCTWYRLDANGQADRSQPYDPPPPDGTYAWLSCTRYGQPSIDTATTRQSGATVAAGAVERLPLPDPVVSANPAVDADQVVGVPTWLWVQNFQPLAVTAFAAGTTADLIATPMQVSFDMGDGGAPLVMGVDQTHACRAPGVAYDVSLPSAGQHSACTYTYERSSAGQPSEEFTVTATTTWALAWSSTTGQSGDLDPLTRSSTFTLRVAEAQALVTG